MASSLAGAKIKRISMADQVAERIKQTIVNGTWQNYSKMPSEAELAEMYGVNKLTVRLALQKLNTIGIVETRIGDGSYVIPFSLQKHLEDINEFILAPELLDDVCEFRKVVEIQCALLAIDRATPEELDELENKCIAYEEYEPEYIKNIGKPPQERQAIIEKLAELDLDIHSYICQISHNTLLYNAFTVAQGTVYQFLKVILKQRMDRYIDGHDNYPFKLHPKLCAAIKAKDYEACKKHYMEMVDHHIIFDNIK